MSTILLTQRHTLDHSPVTAYNKTNSTTPLYLFYRNMKTIVSNVIVIIMFTSLMSMTFNKSAQAHSSGFERFGDVAMIAIPVTAGFISLWKGDKEGFFQLAEGQIYTGALTHGLQLWVDAERPNGNGLSWPSGHAAAAAQGAAYLQFRYGWEYGLPAYATTVAVAWSRVNAGKHHWRDVISSIILATGIQYIITVQEFSLTNLIISPYLEGDKVGVYASFTF